MTERVAIISGIRTPFCKAGGVFKNMDADELGVYPVKELASRAPFDKELIDEVIIGNVLQPPHATNIARVIAVRAGLPIKVPAYTVNRNCASGMEAVSSGADKILLGEADLILAGGVESMSHFQILFPSSMRDFLSRLSKAKSVTDKLLALSSFRPSMLYPVIPSIQDPLCGLTMGQTAEKITRELRVSREEQDAFALRSHQKALKAFQDGFFKDEVMAVPLPPSYATFQEKDDGIRGDTTLASLAKLKPAFEKVNGTVTAGNSSQVTDGACMLFLASEKKAKELGVEPLAYLRGFAEAGLDPSRMGLGPVFATAKLLKQENVSLEDIDLIEINEAFAGQVVSVLKAFGSDAFAKEHLGLSRALGKVDEEKVNIHGGAVALGHPLGASGARLILTLARSLRQQKKRLGLATLCVGGGQGQACLIEV